MTTYGEIIKKRVIKELVSMIGHYAGALYVSKLAIDGLLDGEIEDMTNMSVSEIADTLIDIHYKG